MAELGEAGAKYVADLAHILKDQKESFYKPKEEEADGFELAKSELVKSRGDSKLVKSRGDSELVKSRGDTELVKSELVKSG